MSNSLGEKLRKARRAQGLCQSELAAIMFQTATKTNNCTISRWENDRVEPSLPSIRKLALALNLPVSYFTDNTSETLEAI